MGRAARCAGSMRQSNSNVRRHFEGRGFWWRVYRGAMLNSRRLQRISNHIAPSATAGWAAVYKTEEPQPPMQHRSLRGLTLFITGASRGIGLAIALRAARDGANIVIAAKSETEDPRCSTASAAPPAASHFVSGSLALYTPLQRKWKRLAVVRCPLLLIFAVRPRWRRPLRVPLRILGGSIF